MNRDSLIFVSLVMILILGGVYAGTVFSGILMKDNVRQFKEQIDQINDKVDQVEVYNRKLRSWFAAVGLKQLELSKRVDLVRQKEKEIARLSQLIATLENPATREKYKKELFKRIEERDELRRLIDQKIGEIDYTRQNLGLVSKHLNKSSSAIDSLNRKMNGNGKTPSEKDVKDMMEYSQQLDECKKGGKFELDAEKIIDKDQVDERDRLLVQAFKHYYFGYSTYSMKRVAQKISSRSALKELRDFKKENDIK